MVRKKSIPESKEKVLKPCGFRTFVAAGEGFEPSHTESESAVLPLHNPAIFQFLFSSVSHEQVLLYRKI